MSFSKPRGVSRYQRGCVARLFRGGAFPLRPTLPLRVLFCLILGFCFSASPALARELRIQGFHSEIVVLPDSTLDVTETIDVQFIGSWNGIYRTIPVEYPGPGGFNYSLFLTGATATEGTSGPALQIEKSRQGPNLEFKIYVPGAADNRHTILLHYRVKNGLRYFDDHDELYWNVTGTDWTVPLGPVTAHAVLPVGVTGVRAAEYTGAYGSRAQGAQVDILGSNVTARTLHPLAYREGLTLVVGWDKGFVTAPTRSDLVAQFLQSNWPLFLPVVAFLSMYWLWYTRGRDPRVGSVAVRYEPPNGLSPGEAGALVDDSADMRDVTASIVDLAVRGFLDIEEKKTEHMMGLYSSQDYAFILKKKPAQWMDTKPHELLLLAGLFDSGTRDYVELSELQNRFYKNLPGIRKALFDSLVKQGYYAHRPDEVRGVFIGAALVAAALLIAMGQYLAQKLGMQALPFTIAGAGTAVIVAAFGWIMPARTVAGARARLGVLGFEDFLGRVEGDRLERMTSTTPMSQAQTFEKYLPFAMALGVEKKWAASFDGVFKEPPSWYHAPPGTMFRGMYFANSLSAMSARTGQALASAPRSSSGSSGFGGGGGGGGFSGGGFGGGGGGGF
jgi:uncharacterized membrane protein YgcG